MEGAGLRDRFQERSSGAAGINSTLRIFADLGHVVVILYNYDMGMIQIYPKIEALLTKNIEGSME